MPLPRGKVADEGRTKGSSIAFPISLYVICAIQLIDLTIGSDIAPLGFGFYSLKLRRFRLTAKPTKLFLKLGLCVTCCKKKKSRRLGIVTDQMSSPQPTLN